jgi:hypothetical protein
MAQEADGVVEEVLPMLEAVEGIVVGCGCLWCAVGAEPSVLVNGASDISQSVGQAG